MASHSNTLAWKISWTEEPGGLQSLGSQKSWTRLSDFDYSCQAGRDLGMTQGQAELGLDSGDL